MIDTLNSNGITISRGGVVFKLYYLEKEHHYFGYFINDSGILPVKSNNNNEVADFIYNKLNETTGDINIHFKYSVKLPKKKKKQIQALFSNDNMTFNYYNISKLIRLIK